MNTNNHYLYNFQGLRFSTILIAGALFCKAGADAITQDMHNLTAAKKQYKLVDYLPKSTYSIT